MRRPLIQLDREGAADPVFIVAPGLVREHLTYLVAGLYRGDFVETFARSRLMRAWIGGANNRRGHAFNREVAARMHELGWEVKHDLKPTAILGRALPKDYGDVDVLAWQPSSSRILIMECKDLQFRKTAGEIAEQLADFRGGLDKRGKPDLLRKHLERCELLETDLDAVARYCRINSPVSLERHLVFRNPVPMQFAWDRLKGQTRLHLYDDLSSI